MSCSQTNLLKLQCSCLKILETPHIYTDTLACRKTATYLKSRPISALYLWLSAEKSKQKTSAHLFSGWGVVVPGRWGETSVRVRSCGCGSQAGNSLSSVPELPLSLIWASCRGRFPWCQFWSPPFLEAEKKGSWSCTTHLCSCLKMEGTLQVFLVLIIILYSFMSYCSKLEYTAHYKPKDLMHAHTNRP